jgi:hypothetical protein
MFDCKIRWFSWQSVSYPILVNANGGTIYQLPANSQPASIALTDSGWLVDSLRQVLVKFPKQTESLLYLPFVKK